MRARCKCTSDDSISKYNPNIIHRKPLTHLSLVHVGTLSTGFWRSHRSKFVTYHKHVPLTLMQCSLSVVEEHWNLKLSQLERWYNEDHSICTEKYILKLLQYFYHVGTFDQLHVQSEVVLSRKFGLAKKVVWGTKIPGKWSAWTIYPCKIWSGYWIMV